MSTIIINETQISTFLNRCSFSGLKVLYAIKLSFDKKIAFDRKHFTKEAYVQSDDYFYGFFVACAAMELFTYNSKNNVITVTSVNPLLSQKIEAKTKEMAKLNPPWLDDVTKLEKYFS
jgi:hypothetical protein